VGVFVSTLLAFLAIGAALPVLPGYVRGPLRAGDVAVGIVVGAFAVTAVVCRPLAGRQADARGRRAVLVAGALAMALGGALYLLSRGVASLVAARLVVGAGEGAVYTAGATWAVDLAPEDKRGLALGLFGLSVWGGLSLGPLAGELLRSGVGYDAVWTATAALPLAGALIALRLPEPPRAAALGAPAPLAFFPRVAYRPGIALALANVGYAALAGFVVLHLRARGIGGGASVFTAFALAVFACAKAVNRQPDRRRPARGGRAGGDRSGAFARRRPVRGGRDRGWVLDAVPLARADGGGPDRWGPARLGARRVHGVLRHRRRPGRPDRGRDGCARGVSRGVRTGRLRGAVHGRPGGDAHVKLSRGAPTTRGPRNRSRTRLPSAS
jgi:MFS family permease